MEKSEKNPASSSAGPPFTAASGPTREANSRRPSTIEAPGLDGALAWVKDSPLLAVLGAFAAGTFIGVMARD